MRFSYLRQKVRRCSGEHSVKKLTPLLLRGQQTQPLCFIAFCIRLLFPSECFNLILNRYVQCKNNNGFHRFLAFYILQYLGPWGRGVLDYDL
jgi:hypothetical protein